MNIAIVGATGLVGRQIIKSIKERGLKAEKYYLFATERSEGTRFEIFGKEYVVHALTPSAIIDKRIDLALFSAGKAVARSFAPLLVGRGAYVVDNSSAFRMDQTVPLVVPEVNPEDLNSDSRIIANPNCSTIQATVAIKPIEDYKRIKRMVISTYQAVSGAGQSGVIDLKNGINCKSPQKIPRQIFSNCVPQVDDFGANGYTFEEDKMMNESRKILKRPDLKVTATCVRVPVFNCHSESISIEFYDDFDLNVVKNILRKAKGVRYFDDYPTAVDADGKDDVCVGRLRRDYSVENGLNLWCVADNVRKGAAVNAVEIAELLLKAGKISAD